LFYGRSREIAEVLEELRKVSATNLICRIDARLKLLHCTLIVNGTTRRTPRSV
jgi:hypothetical protein